MKRLSRSRKDQKISGVIGGLGEYFGIDSNVLRLATILLFFFTAGLPVLVTYIAAWFILPEAPYELKSGEREILEETPSEPASSH
ncbi:MAG: PspC domain-containing protein [Calditrichaeota bacterium]|nr:PspC domain-containing protein [Calditrichota bacterium]MCB0266742.1 PspC domain-containing protein [Calditrichota bacterium]